MKDQLCKLMAIILSILLLSPLLYAGTTGKIAGTVTDARTAEKLIGANVMVEGTTLGATTDLEGYFVILNVPSGTYRLRASMVGYTPSTIVDVRVNIDQTTTVNFQLNEAAVTTQEVVVVATRPVVDKDVAASRVNLNASEIQSLPVVSVASVVGLQAGVQGMVIRGGGSNQTAFMLDGLTLRDERDNTPYTAVSYSAIEDIQIQIGGFSAEYGNIRSGVINVITKEATPNRYSFSMISRYSPPAQKHFGISPNDPTSYWIRPYVDPAVCWSGTKNGAWDFYTQQLYPEFEGWKAVAEKTLKDGDPNNDLTPEAAQKVFLWEHRRELDITKPDYVVDFSFGGPIPVISEQLGNLRFFASYRELRNMLLVPLETDNYYDNSAQLKITSDVGRGMKLMVEGLLAKQTGTNSNNTGGPGIFSSSEGISDALSNGPKYIDGRFFGTDYWCPATVKRNMFGAKFSHVINPTTFYEVTLQEFGSNYDTNPGRLRDTSKIYKFGNNYYLDEAPIGFQPKPSTGIVGLRMGVGMSNSRDSSTLNVWSGRFDMTSQIDKYNQIKAGLEFTYTDNNVNYGSVDEFLPSGRSKSVWHTYPTRGAGYLRDKLEYEGMIAELGLRLDYSYAGGYWYQYYPYDPALSGAYSLGLDTLLEHEPTKRILTLNPRLAISFPITENAKLYFNYGHFRQMPTPENLYMIRRYTDNNAVVWLANPNNPLPKTVAYELGYEQNLFDQYLVRVTGYYKDVSDQSFLVTYTNRNSTVNYSVSTPNSYEDIRGFEIEARKNRGNWVQGFINYTYMVRTTGYFGLAQHYENPTDQRTYERTNVYQVKPLPAPYARANIDFFTPPDFGPKLGGINLLGDWRLNVLGVWTSGDYSTWVGGGSVPGVQYNVQWKDYFNIDLRLSKNFRIAGANIQLFMDIYNALNIKYFTPGEGFVDVNDYNAYMKSLHLADFPADYRDKIGYVNIPGDDRPGEYRDDGVQYQPIVGAGDLSSVTNPVPTAIYWDRSTGRYMQNTGGGWSEVDQGRIDQILKDKAYIKNPLQPYFAFLNPRDIYFGIRVNFDLNF